MNKILISISLLVLITSCATLSQSQCQSGDWYGIGLSDGAQGAGLSKLSQHRDSCGEYAIKINGEAWRNGRAEGLKQYCRTVNGYQLGRYGNQINNVCPNNLAGNFSRAYNYGMKIYILSQKLVELESSLYDVEQAILDETLSREDRKHHLDDLKQLEREIHSTKYQIDDMEARNPYSR
jgi:hypothetical protein